MPFLETKVIKVMVTNIRIPEESHLVVLKIKESVMSMAIHPIAGKWALLFSECGATVPKSQSDSKK